MRRKLPNSLFIGTELKKTADVSVIVPTYNASQTIYRALNSIINQSVLPYEVIIIDDFSQDVDHLRSIIDSFAVSASSIKFNLIINEHNMNGAASRNRGIKQATSKYIAFLDADDEWMPQKLEILLDRISNSKSSLLIYSPVEVWLDGTPKEVRPNRGISKDGDMSEYLFLLDGFIQTSTILCDSILAKRVLFNEDFKRHQDYDFCLRIAAEKVDILYIPVPLCKYHVNSSVKSKKIEDPSYSYWWAQKMKFYMSDYGYHAFCFFNLTGRYMNSGRHFAAVINIFTSSYKLGFRGLWRARLKLARQLTQKLC